jgi:hypothetical protein
MSPLPTPRDGPRIRRRYRTEPLIVQPAEFVPLSPSDERRALAALAELLAPLFTLDSQIRPPEEVHAEAERG